MAKSKSSASSATRKKQAAKQAKKKGATEEELNPSHTPQKAQRGQKKQKKDRFAPKIKSYVPPPPPPKGAPDPVDVYLISRGKQIDPELVVVLRRLAKKDEATIGKGVDAFESAVQEVLRREREQEGEDWERELKEEELLECIAVWAHHFPRLALHPSRRLRLAVHSLHALLSSASTPLLRYTRSALLSSQWTDQPNYVGAWCVSAFDSDRTVRNQAYRTWESVLSPATEASEGSDAEGINLVEQAEAITQFAFSLVLGSPQSDTSGSDTPEDPAFLRTSAISALVYLLQKLPTPLPLEEGTIETLLSEELWEMLTVRDQEKTGEREQPKMVRRALYELLGAIASRQEDLLIVTGNERTDAEEDADETADEQSDERLRVISCLVLDNCWTEEEGWPGIIGFLRRYPQAWTLADNALEAPASIDGGSIDGDEEEEEEISAQSAFVPSPTLHRLLAHLSLACSSHPTALYPTILLLLSTIPASILPVTGSSASQALGLLFENFYAAYASRAVTIGGVQASEAWLGALLECLVFETSKVQEDQLSVALCTEWVGRTWRAFLNLGEEASTRGLASRRTAEEFEKLFTRLAAREDRKPYEAAWISIEEDASRIFAGEVPDAKSLSALVMAFRALLRSPSQDVAQNGRSLIKRQVLHAITAIRQGQDEGREDMLGFLASAKDLIKDEQEVQEQLDDLCLQLLPAYMPTSAASLSLLISHIASTSPSSRSSIWHSLFATSPTPIVLLRLIDAVKLANISKQLPSADLDTEVLKIAQKVLSGAGSQDELETLRKIMLEPAPFVEQAVPSRLCDLAVDTLEKIASPALASSAALPTSAALSPLVPATALLAHFAHSANGPKQLGSSERAVIGLFRVAYILPLSRIETSIPGEAVAAAQQAWQEIARHGNDTVVETVIASLKAQIVDVDARPSAIETVQAASILLQDSHSQRFTLDDILANETDLHELYKKMALSDPTPELSVVVPLVTLSAAAARPAPSRVDSAYLTAYPRALLAFLDVASRDHALARKSLWVVPHLLLLSNCARDELALSAYSTGMFGRAIPQEILERLLGASEGASSYFLSLASNALADGWHAKAVTHLRSKEVTTTDDQLLRVLDGLAREARGTDAKAFYAQRAVSTVLSSALRYSEAGPQDAERWLAFAQNLTSAPGLARAILLAIKPVLLETPRFERYQNELAASLAGVPASKLDTTGLPLLQLLLATAPPSDAPIIFLPQQRTMFLIQAIQRWVGSDDGVPEEANAAVIELLSHLVAIIQDLSGSHWDLVFDLIESNLDGAEWEEPSALPAIHQSCLLLAQMQELSNSNKELRSIAKSRVESCLELVLKLFVSRPVSQDRNDPRAAVVATMSRLIRDLPPRLLTMDKSFEQLLRLLQDPSLAVQISSFNLLQRVVQKHVEDLVVEVELDAEEKIEIELPSSLVKLLEVKLDVDELEDPFRASAYLLSWLTTFAFFGPASPRLRSAYLEQIRNHDLVAASLLPSLFSLLNLSDRSRPTELSPWSVDDFHLEVVDTLDELTLPVFAAHVYYRSLQAIPSLIRAYWASLQNLQLSRTIQSFTSRNFSPLLIASELFSLRDPSSETGKQLRDNDDFTVKVAAGANEVKCVFVVDEESMEIGIKVPSEFPLIGVEVKDVRKVGVTDKQWRAWLLAMQQVISTQSAAIADALVLFKRNVTLHFEGVESCAICYSTVSTVDRSLPSKSCKTCDNKFHAGCLYKWFQTSHGSSCPLCRQIM